VNLTKNIEIQIEVFADYQPHEPETLESPAVEADIENIVVYLNDLLISDHLTDSQIESIKSQLWESLHKQRSGISD
jgi:hypothetical protein